MKRALIIGTGVIVLGLGWALFRPELVFIDKSVNETFPAVAHGATSTMGTVELATGAFHNGAHETNGMATIFQTGGGKRVLRLTNFKTSNGPDVRVLLVAAADATDNDTVKTAGSIELGALKGNVGDQNYDVPEGVDLAKYRTVTIWCNRFGVNFGSAPLREASMRG